MLQRGVYLGDTSLYEDERWGDAAITESVAGIKGCLSEYKASKVVSILYEDDCDICKTISLITRYELSPWVRSYVRPFSTRYYFGGTLNDGLFIVTSAPDKVADVMLESPQEQKRLRPIGGHVWHRDLQLGKCG